MKDYYKLEELVSNWAYERDLVSQDPLIQNRKILEEVTELTQALAQFCLLHDMEYDDFEEADTLSVAIDNVTDDLTDAIGDVMVTLLVLCEQINFDLVTCLDRAYEEIKDRKGKIVKGSFVKEDPQTNPKMYHIKLIDLSNLFNEDKIYLNFCKVTNNYTFETKEQYIEEGYVTEFTMEKCIELRDRLSLEGRVIFEEVSK